MLSHSRTLVEELLCVSLPRQTSQEHIKFVNLCQFNIKFCTWHRIFNFQIKTLVILILAIMEVLVREKEIISNVLVEKGIQENSANVSIQFTN